MSGPNDLFDAAAEWLALCEAAVATTTGGAIPRSFVSLGPPSWDCCPQLSVHAAVLLADTQPFVPLIAPGHRMNVQDALALVPLVATVLRCVPTFEDSGDPPSTSAMEAAAMAGYADAWAILSETWQGKRDGTLFAPKERELFIDPIVPLTQAGGCGGFQIQIRVQLNRYHP